MKKIDLADINEMSKVYRLNLINSVSGYKSANLIGSTGSSGDNLAIFSSVIHLGSNPPLLGFIMRPTQVGRDTYNNIKENGYYSINHIHESMVERAHYTSAKFDSTESEFEACNLEKEIIDDFKAPFVAESKLKLAMRLVEEKLIEANDTILIVGEIEAIFVEEKAVMESGELNLNQIEEVCISGLNRYHKVAELAQFPYARVSEKPNF